MKIDPSIRNAIDESLHDVHFNMQDMHRVLRAVRDDEDACAPVRRKRFRLDFVFATALMALTDRLEAATVSACPTCRSRIVAVVALVDLLGAAPPFARSSELIELADEAPTLHLYVRDLSAPCDHRAWRDPGFDEWSEALDDLLRS